MNPEPRDTIKPPLFAVIRTRGPAWNDAQPIEGQVEWEAHRSFMNALEEARFVIVGGPLEGTADVLLIVRAGGADEIVSRFAEDPWSTRDLLRTGRITPWRLRIGTLP